MMSAHMYYLHILGRGLYEQHLRTGYLHVPGLFAGPGVELPCGDVGDSAGGAGHGDLLAQEPPHLAGWVHHLESLPSVTALRVCARKYGLELTVNDFQHPLFSP